MARYERDEHSSMYQLQRLTWQASIDPDIENYKTETSLLVRCSPTLGDNRVMPVTNGHLSRTRHESGLVSDDEDTAERLKTSEKLISELNETWEEKIRKSDEIRKHRFCFALNTMITNITVQHNRWSGNIDNIEGLLRNRVVQ